MKVLWLAVVAVATLGGAASAPDSTLTALAAQGALEVEDLQQLRFAVSALTHSRQMRREAIDLLVKLLDEVSSETVTWAQAVERQVADGAIDCGALKDQHAILRRMTASLDTLPYNETEARVLRKEREIEKALTAESFHIARDIDLLVSALAIARAYPGGQDAEQPGGRPEMPDISEALNKQLDNLLAIGRLFYGLEQAFERFPGYRRRIRDDVPRIWRKQLELCLAQRNVAEASRVMSENDFFMSSLDLSDELQGRLLYLTRAMEYLHEQAKTPNLARRALGEVQRNVEAVEVFLDHNQVHQVARKELAYALEDAKRHALYMGYALDNATDSTISEMAASRAKSRREILGSETEECRELASLALKSSGIAGEEYYLAALRGGCL